MFWDLAYHARLSAMANSQGFVIQGEWLVILSHKNRFPLSSKGLIFFTPEVNKFQKSNTFLGTEFFWECNCKVVKVNYDKINVSKVCLNFVHDIAVTLSKITQWLNCTENVPDRCGTTEPDPCPGVTCVNLQAGLQCVCPYSYALQQDNRTCQFAYPTPPKVMAVLV